MTVVLTPAASLGGVQIERIRLIPNSLGADSLELVGTEGVCLAAEGNETLFPVPDFEESYAFSPSTEGGQRTSSRATLIAGQGHAWLLGDDEFDVSTLEHQWEKAIDACRRDGGVLFVEPLVGDNIAYQITSAKILTQPYNPSRRKVGVGETTFEFQYEPFGHLEEIEVVSWGGSVPITSQVVPELPGSADALAKLTIHDPEGQARYHVEGGFESRYWDAASGWSVLIDSDDMDPLEGAVAGRAGYGGASKRQTLDVADGQTGIASAEDTHIGRFRVKGRFYATAEEVSVRMSVSVRGGTPSFGAWQTVILDNVWCEIDLGVAGCEPPRAGTDQLVQISVYAKSASGAPTIDLDYLKIIPAERYFKASGPVGSKPTVRASSDVQIRWDGIISHTSAGVWADHPNASGPGLRIPTKGGRIAVALNRNNLDVAEHTVLGDQLDATLVVIPRVALRGARVATS